MGREWKSVSSFLLLLLVLLVNEVSFLLQVSWREVIAFIRVHVSRFVPVPLCREDRGTRDAVIPGTDPGVLVNRCWGAGWSSCLLATNLYLFFPCWSRKATCRVQLFHLLLGRATRSLWFAFCWSAVFGCVWKRVQFWRDEIATAVQRFHYCIIPGVLCGFPAVFLLERAACFFLPVLSVPAVSCHCNTGLN